MTSLTTFKSPVPDRIYITRSALRLIEDEARHGNSTSLENETGGILIGRRLDATNRLELLIIAATGPGDNAYHHPVEFSPDIEYVNGKLQEYHARYPRTDYIGTWHKHPPRYQRFSQGDVDTAHAVFRDPAYKVKEIINPIVWVDQGKFTIRYYYMSRQMARQGDPFYEVQIARIMLIDDDHAMVQREAVASSTTIGATNDLISEEYRLLSEHGYQVKLCNEGAEYFFEVRSERVSDLVIYFVAPANFPQLPPVLMVECGGEALPPNDGGIINQWTYRNGAAHLVDVVEGVMASIPVCLGDLTEVLRCVLPKCAVVRRQNDRHGSIGMTHQPLTASDDSRAERIGYEVKMIRDMGYSCDLQQSPEGMTHYLTVELTRDTMEGPQPVRAYIKLDAEFPASPPMLVVTVLIPGSTSANELNELPGQSHLNVAWSWLVRHDGGISHHLCGRYDMPLLRDVAIGSYFATVDDPRVERTRDHALLDIIIIAVCAVICGADGWVAVEEFGITKRDWLATFLTLPNGIPSHDTFGRVFARINPEQFQRSFLSWVESLKQVRGDLIAIDGKTHRGARDRSSGKAALHLVSAWAAENRIVLGQVAVDTKSNEITAIPALLDLLDLHGSTVTIDAMGCQTTIADQIVRQGGNYVLALKANQPSMLADVQALFTDACAAQQPEYGMTSVTATDSGHGRTEQRTAYVISDPEVIAYLNEGKRWRDLTSVAMIESQRTVNDTTTVEQRYYLLNQCVTAATVNDLVRGHWGIENRLHWVLDVIFHEDASRIRTGDAPQNMGVVRHIALNLLRQESSTISLRMKRFRAALSDTYLEKVLGL